MLCALLNHLSQDFTALKSYQNLLLQQHKSIPSLQFVTKHSLVTFFLQGFQKKGFLSIWKL